MVALLIVVLLGACGGPEPEPDLSAVGPHSTASSTRIVYDEKAPPLGISFASFESGWSDLAASVDGAVDLREGERNGDQITYVAETETSGIALDVVVESGEIQIAQLALVDAVGDEDDPQVLAAVIGFLSLIDAGFDADRFALTGEEPLFSERS